jgi:hypothetical protein
LQQKKDLLSHENEMKKKNANSWEERRMYALRWESTDWENVSGFDSMTVQ